MKLNKIEFKDFITLQRGFDLPLARMKEGDIPVLGSNCVIGYHNEAKVQPPGVVTGRSGTLGIVQYIDVPYWPHNTALWVRDFKGNHPKFVYYKLRILNLGSFSSGASVPTLNRNNLDNIQVSIPSNEIQSRIASILSTYDDLIENNLRRIKLLEESARQLYKEWFVRLRFPGYEHTNIVNGVPEGWEKKFVPEIIDINPPTPILRDLLEINYVPMSSLSVDQMTISFAHFERRTKATGVKFKNGDILFPRITPCLENGKTAFVNFLLDGEIACGSTEFIVLRNKFLYPEFVYCLSRTYDFRENAIKSMIGSSGRLRVQTSCFEDYTIQLPPKLILRQFQEIVVPVFKQIEVLQFQIQKLRQARDLLLPKLMSGEVEIND